MSPESIPSCLVVAVTSRALCDLETDHAVFLQEGEAGYMAYQQAHMDDPIRWGTAYGLVKKLLALNEPGQPPVVEVCLVSRNDPVTGLRVLRAVEAEGLPIEKAVFTKGRDPFVHLESLGVHLFLSAEPEDVRGAIRAGFAAAQVMPRPADDTQAGTQELRVALDGDATIFDGSAEEVFRQVGVERFHAHERAHANEPLGPGPMAPFLAFLCRMQARRGGMGIRTYLVTARAVAAHARAINSLLAMGVTVDEAFFLGGHAKASILRTLAPDIFFDDGERHVEAAKDLVPTGRILAS